MNLLNGIALYSLRMKKKKKKEEYNIKDERRVQGAILDNEDMKQ